MYFILVVLVLGQNTYVLYLKCSFFLSLTRMMFSISSKSLNVLSALADTFIRAL